MTNHPSWAWFLFGDDDPTVTSTPAPIGTLYLRKFLNPSLTVFNGALYLKTGAGNTAWTLVGGTEQRFGVTLGGAEGTAFTVSLPSARPDANYQVQVQMAGPAANAIKIARPLAASRSVIGFDVELSAAAEAGDVLWFTVSDPS